MRIKLILALVAVCGALLACWLIKYQYDKITALEAQKNELATILEKEKANALETGKRIKELNKIIANNPDSKSWADLPIDEPILNGLRKQYLSARD